MQHYVFAHRILPALFLEDPQGFARAIERDGTLLRRLWARSGPWWKRFLGAGRIGHRKRGLPDGATVLVVTLPPPRMMTEAHFVGLLIAPAQDEAAFFTLERHDGSDGRVSTVLGGWSAKGHANYGDGPAPTVDAFVDAIGRLRQPRSG